MAKLLWLTYVLVAGAAIYFAYLNTANQNVDLSRYRVDGYFGRQKIKAGQPIPKDSTEIRPFTVNITNANLQDLNSRLANARYVDHIEGTKFTYGFSSNYLKQVIEYWRTKYNWRQEEAKLNAYSQYLTQVEGIDIHFVRVKPSKPAKTVVPLLVIHGWPGSVLEYYKSFPLLTEPDQNGFDFEVIAPSIPGYGFSEAPHQKGFNSSAVARVFVKLMKRLGHDKFVVHGGDWGNLITRTISIVFPENVIGAHLLGNWDPIYFTKVQVLKAIFATYFPSLFFSAESRDYDYAKLFPFSEKFIFILSESGYHHLQSTKPDTVGAGLVDSPVGLAAYILEKFSTWTNPAYRYREDGGLTEKYTLDELLTNVMIYWTSGNIAASQRFYKENNAADDEIVLNQITVPAATVDAPHELVRAPRQLVEDHYTNLVQYTEIPRGGHFTAFEEPQLVADDLRKFVRKVIEKQNQKE